MHMFDRIFCICVPLYIYLPDDDIVEVKICRRDISDMIIYLLLTTLSSLSFIIDYAVCWIKHCIINLLHG